MQIWPIQNTQYIMNYQEPRRGSSNTVATRILNRYYLKSEDDVARPCKVNMRQQRI